MAGLWNKLKKSLTLKLSLHPQTPKDPPPLPLPEPPQSDSDSRSMAISRSSSSLSRLARSISARSSTKTCAICLANLKMGKGQAIFTAECSHSFHFRCIASSVKHGNHVCPICRSKWKDIPFQHPNNVVDPQLQILGQVHHNQPEDVLANVPRNLRQLSMRLSEPHQFADDEPLPAISAQPPSSVSGGHPQTVTVKAIPEFPAIAASESVSSFAAVLAVRAPPLRNDARHLERAPIDLVTVLDVSGSMSGSKLGLLKRAVRFVIQNLGSSDRLAIIAFSSSARRVIPLRIMSDRGREDALYAVNSLSANGGTNIVEGLKKGVRILEERRERNPVSSIILLSDGKDTYNDNFNQRQSSQRVVEYLKLLPASICPSNSTSPPTIPVHTFGFGSDHDSAAMHAISDASGGTFSFIESLGIIQDAFARCIGGLLSVVAQELRLTMRSASPGVNIYSIPSGKYSSGISEQGQQGVIDVGDLYAEEEKEFLVYLSVPVVTVAEGEEIVENSRLLDVVCSYRDAVSKEKINLEEVKVEIRRPNVLSPTDVLASLEVDRQRNRLLVAEGIAEAKELAEAGNLEGAQVILANRRAGLLASASAQAGDGLCIWLETELREIRERMGNMELYEQTGRAYVLSGLSSHSWQRATTRGDSTTHSVTTLSSGGESGNLTNSRTIGYDTPSMVSMVNKSQVLNFSGHPEQVSRLNKSSSMTPRGR